MVSVPCQGTNHHSTSDFYKNLLLFVIINFKIPTCWWFLILQLSPWGSHKRCSQARGGWSPVFFLLPFSIFPPFSSFFQVSRPLPAYNLNWYSFWGTYLTTSDPEHKEHTYFSYLLCLRKLFKKNFHFRLFLKFWMEVEEYFLKNTVFIFECSPHDWWSMSPLPCLCSYPGPCYHHFSPSSDLFMGGQQWWEWAWEEERPPWMLPAASRITGTSHPGNMVWAWLSREGQLKETALVSPSAESSLSFLSSLHWGVETQTSLLPTHLKGRQI